MRAPNVNGLKALLSPALAILATASLAVAQQASAPPPIAPDLQAALAKADAGQSGELLALADSGRADAQYYAGQMLMTGRGGTKPDAAKACAYEEKAAASRADAAFLVGECYRQGLGGQRDAAKAKAAYTRASQMGFPKAKCALGQMLMAEPGQGEQGLALCKEAAKAGDVDAQVALGDAYYRGNPAVKADPKEARKWYDLAADQKNAQASRTLGTMYANGEGGKKDTKQAVKLWQAAEQAGDPLAAILVADQLFSDLTGGRKPGPGQYAFRGGVPVADIEAIEAWYKEAQERDPRPEVKARAKYALSVLESFKTAANTVQVKQR
jgi:TPR repeat protein